MSRNRRPQGGVGANRRSDRKESWAWAATVASRDERKDGRRDQGGGDCAACGWITARPTCPMCGAAILDEVSA